MSQPHTPSPQAVFGETCRDGGTCHHGCTQAGGCFRQSCCSPLSMSGLDLQWRTPQEAAAEDARDLDQCSAAAPPVRKPSL